MNQFCPELQLPWGLRRLEFPLPTRLRIVVSASYPDPLPEPMGRHVADISSYPRIWTDFMEAEFLFEDVVWFELRDEMAASLSEDEQGEGETFCRFVDSKLLRKQKNSWGDGTPTAESLKHYRLVCADTLIDVICRKVPVIGRRPYREPKSPLAG